MTTPERTPVRLPSLAAATGDLWTLLIDLATHTEAVPWTLVGGQMVMLHGLERDRVSPRVSADIDTVVDLRAKQDGLHALVKVFERLGLEPVGPPSPDGIMHRYVKPGTDVTVDLATASVDVLVPEGLGPNTDTRTSGGGRTVEVKGGTQALHRTEKVPVTYQDRTADVPRPDLLGALVIKAAATEIELKSPIRHFRDLAFLSSLVEDPFTLRQQTSKTDRRRLGSAAARMPEDDSLWTALGEHARDARAAWKILTTNT